MKRSKSQYAFQVFDVVFMVLIMATIIVPILNILSLSVSSADAIRSGSVTFYPKGFSLDAYKDIIGNRLFASSVYNTVFTTVVGTILAVAVTLLVAYALTKDFVGWPRCRRSWPQSWRPCGSSRSWAGSGGA